MPLVDEIINLHELMTEYMLKAGAGPKGWEKLISTVGKWSDRRLEYVHSRLKSLFENEWKNYRDIRTQFCATEEMWANMEMFFDHEAFPEQVRLRDAAKKLREAWRDFKSKYTQFLKDEKEEVPTQFGTDD